MAIKEAYKKVVRWQGKSYSPTDFKIFIEAKLNTQLADWERDIYSFSLDWMNEKQEYFEVQTSGSTGQAKTISISRLSMISSAHKTASFLSLQAEQYALLCLPAKYIAGKMMIVRALVVGMHLFYQAPVLNISKNIVRNFDFCAMIPLQIQYAMDHQVQENLNKIATVIIGGAALSSLQIMELQKQKSTFFATYGMTETISHIALQKLNGKDKEDCFQCLDGISIEKDEEDCLLIHSKDLGDFKTNDLIEITSPGCFKIIGRKDFIINSGGLKINPEKLEHQIAHLVPFSFMIGYKKDEILGQKLVILLENSDPKYPFIPILQEIKKLVSSKYTPKEVYFIPKLYVTNNHKIDRVRCNEYINS